MIIISLLRWTHKQTTFVICSHHVCKCIFDEVLLSYRTWIVRAHVCNEPLNDELMSWCRCKLVNEFLIQLFPREMKNPIVSQFAHIFKGCEIDECKQMCLNFARFEKRVCIYLSCDGGCFFFYILLMIARRHWTESRWPWIWSRGNNIGASVNRWWKNGMR